MGTRYDFGRNWSELAACLTDDHVSRAKSELRRLTGELEGSTFLDVGCGSGLHAVAALRLGARNVHAVDYDPDCVATTRAVLERFAPNGSWQVDRGDVLDPDGLPKGVFDVVYSWGVLHHTGDMWAAICNTADRVAPGGKLALALYVRTPLCAAWTMEKRVYSHQKWLRPLIKYPYTGALLLSRAVRQRDAISYVRDYRKARGMEFLVDVDDWLGGYPYESVRPEELESRVEGMGYRLHTRFNTKSSLGLFGAGCGEWRFDRSTSLEPAEPPFRGISGRCCRVSAVGASPDMGRRVHTPEPGQTDRRLIDRIPERR